MNLLFLSAHLSVRMWSSAISRLAASAVLVLSCATAGFAEPCIRSVRVEGNLRVPTASILHHVSMVSGTSFDEAAARSDMRKLHALGLFSFLEVVTEDAGNGLMDVIFRVEERPFVSDFRIEGVKESLKARIVELLQKEHLEFRPSMPFQPATGKRVETAVRDFLRAQKYPNAEAQLVEEHRGTTVSLVLQIWPGPRLPIRQVIFTGNQRLASQDLNKQMRDTRPESFWNRRGGYTPEGLSADLERLDRYYQSAGYAAVSIGKPEISVQTFQSRRLFPLPRKTREREGLMIRIPIDEGSRFQLASVRIEGEAKAASSEIAALTESLQVPRPYDFSLLESIRQKMVAALGRSGYAFAQVRLDRGVHESDKIDAVYRIDAGDPLVVGQIRFEGNRRLPDRFLRRELATQEGDLFDSAKLDESLERLNRSSLVKELQRADIGLELNDRDTLDVTFKVKEKDRQGIYGTGGTGGIGGGYLGLLYTAFNLLGIGEALTVQLDGGAAQSNLLVDLLTRHFLGSPFTLALSGFHRVTNINVARIVPGPEDLIGVLWRRSTGFGVAGTYPLTPAAQFGIGVQLQRDSTREAGGNGGGQTATPVVYKSELTPSFSFDSTRGIGAETRGSKLLLAQSWRGTAFLRSVKSTRPALQYGRYLSAPWGEKKSGLAFQTYATFIQPHGGRALALEERFFPGNEIARGFRRGALSPWSYAPDLGSEGLRPAGADAVGRFSVEYRVPLRGPLSSALFLDLGWTRVRRGDVESAQGARLIEATNGLLRASTGGELRMQLPLIRQPARVIFAWNPLRLHTLLQTDSAPLRIADPRGAIRFALGLND
jgi:outer membrane protein insertion porin family